MLLSEIRAKGQSSPSGARARGSESMRVTRVRMRVWARHEGERPMKKWRKRENEIEMKKDKKGRKTYPERDQSPLIFFKYGSSDMFTIFQYTHPGIEGNVQHESENTFCSHH